MSDISKKYVKALVSLVDKEELSKISALVKEIVPALRDEKLRIILYSNDINNDKKVEFLSSLLSESDEKLINLFKLLAKNGRLELIPTISEELEYQVAKLTNSHKGIVLCDKELSDDKVNEIASKLSSKFDTNIELSIVKSDYNGIKVEVDTLGVEVAFSADRLKDQLKNHILKSI